MGKKHGRGKKPRAPCRTPPPTMETFSPPHSHPRIRYRIFASWRWVLMPFPGVHTWADGRVYSGNFENGREHGTFYLSVNSAVQQQRSDAIVS